MLKRMNRQMPPPGRQQQPAPAQRQQPHPRRAAANSRPPGRRVDPSPGPSQAPMPSSTPLPMGVSSVGDLRQLLTVYGGVLSPENRDFISELIDQLQNGGDQQQLMALAARMRQAASRG